MSHTCTVGLDTDIEIVVAEQGVPEPPCPHNAGDFASLYANAQSLGLLHVKQTLNTTTREGLLQLLEGEDFNALCEGMWSIVTPLNSAGAFESMSQSMRKVIALLQSPRSVFVVRMFEYEDDMLAHAEHVVDKWAAVWDGSSADCVARVEALVALLEQFKTMQHAVDTQTTDTLHAVLAAQRDGIQHAASQVRALPHDWLCPRKAEVLAELDYADALLFQEQQHVGTTRGEAARNMLQRCLLHPLLAADQLSCMQCWLPHNASLSMHRLNTDQPYVYNDAVSTTARRCFFDAFWRLLVAQSQGQNGAAENFAMFACVLSSLFSEVLYTAATLGLCETTALLELSADQLQEQAFRGRIQNHTLLHVVSLWSMTACNAHGGTDQHKQQHEKCVADLQIAIAHQPSRPAGSRADIAVGALCAALQNVYQRLQRARLHITALCCTSTASPALLLAVRTPFGATLEQDHEPTVGAWLANGLGNALEKTYIVHPISSATELSRATAKLHCTAAVHSLHFILSRKALPRTLQYEYELFFRTQHVLFRASMFLAIAIDILTHTNALLHEGVSASVLEVLPCVTDGTCTVETLIDRLFVPITSWSLQKYMAYSYPDAWKQHSGNPTASIVFQRLLHIVNDSFLRPDSNNMQGLPVGVTEKVLHAVKPTIEQFNAMLTTNYKCNMHQYDAVAAYLLQDRSLLQCTL